ncbi:MAG: hypothetical protein O3A46_00975 [Candidatus Poribacteria bacterium]|nr:hypothetical protein [Candidatus Poribacteria bacterium]
MNENPSSESKQKRPFLGIRFDCCGVYQRIYLNKAKTAFVGWCPRCTKRLEVKVSKDGSKNRFFSAQ